MVPNPVIWRYCQQKTRVVSDARASTSHLDLINSLIFYVHESLLCPTPKSSNLAYTSTNLQMLVQISKDTAFLLQTLKPRVLSQVWWHLVHIRAFQWDSHDVSHKDWAHQLHTVGLLRPCQVTFLIVARWWSQGRTAGLNKSNAVFATFLFFWHADLLKGRKLQQRNLPSWEGDG